MRNKFIALCVVVTIMMFSSFSAFASVNIGLDPVTNYLAISGTESEWAGKTLIVQVFNPGKSPDDLLGDDGLPKDITLSEFMEIFSSVRQLTADGQGNFSLTPYELSNSGNYSVKIIPEGITPVYYDKAVYWLSPTYEEDTLELVNGYSDADIALVNKFIDDTEFIGIITDDFADFSETNQLAVLNKLLEKSYSSLDELSTEFDLTVFGFIINESDSAGNVALKAPLYDSVLNENLSVYKLKASSFESELWSKVYSQRTYSGRDKLLKSIGDNIVLLAMKSISNQASVEYILKESQSYLSDYDLSSYFSLSDKKTANTSIMNEAKNCDTIDELCGAVITASKKPTAPPVNPPSGGPSGRPSGNSPSYSVPGYDPNAADSGNQNNPNTGTTPPPSSGFTDLSDCQWAKEAIDYMHSKGIINGVSAAEFQPMREVKREEFVKMLILAFPEIGSETDVNLSDLDKNSWSYEYVSKAIGGGIVNGISDELFGIGLDISREDMAVLLYRAAQKAGIDLAFKSEKQFSDETEISDYALEAVRSFTNAGIINGISENTFSPKSTATRAQAAKLIYELLKSGKGV